MSALRDGSHLDEKRLNRRLLHRVRVVIPLTAQSAENLTSPSVETKAASIDPQIKEAQLTRYTLRSLPVISHED